MEHEMIQQKVKKGAGILRMMAQATAWVAIAVAGLTIIGGILMKLFRGAFSRMLMGGNGAVSIHLGILYYNAPSYLSYQEVVHIYEMMGFVIGVSCVMGALFLRQLVGILKEVEDGRPFSQNNARRLSKMGILVIISSIVYRIGQAAALRTIINMAGVNDFSANYAPNSDMIFLGILLFILAGIFKYGSYLQEEYDATL